MRVCLVLVYVYFATIGFERNSLTGLVLIELRAAYDTLNIRRLLRKLEIWPVNLGLLLSELLHALSVSLTLGKSRRCSVKNLLPHGSVLAPISFNIYTNNQPNSPFTTRFLYAVDLAWQPEHRPLKGERPFKETEENLTVALVQIGTYYDANGIRPNPTKTWTTSGRVLSICAIA